MASIPEEKIAEEITRARVLEKLTNQKIRLFRPPYGEYNSGSQDRTKAGVPYYPVGC